MSVIGFCMICSIRSSYLPSWISSTRFSRCPAGISHPMVGLLARRLTGKYIAPKSEHLEKRVEEIHEGKYDDLIEQIMQKPITDMEELYNNREIEK